VWVSDSKNKEQARFEEWAADRWEQWLREGQPEGRPLSKVFGAIRDWMQAIYGAIKGGRLDGQLTPEIRRVFETLLARPGQNMAKQNVPDGNRASSTYGDGTANLHEFPLSSEQTQVSGETMAPPRARPVTTGTSINQNEKVGTPMEDVAVMSGTVATAEKKSTTETQSTPSEGEGEGAQSERLEALGAATDKLAAAAEKLSAAAEKISGQTAEGGQPSAVSGQPAAKKLKRWRAADVPHLKPELRAAVARGEAVAVNEDGTAANIEAIRKAGNEALLTDNERGAKTLTLESPTEAQLNAEKERAAQKAELQKLMDRKLTGTAGEMTGDMFDQSQADNPLFAPPAPKTAPADYNTLVQQSEAGIAARRRLHDLPESLYSDVMGFAKSGLPLTKAAVVEWLRQRGTVGAVDDLVAKILKHQKDAGSDIASAEADRQLARWKTPSDKPSTEGEAKYLGAGASPQSSDAVELAGVRYDKHQGDGPGGWVWARLLPDRSWENVTDAKLIKKLEAALPADSVSAKWQEEIDREEADNKGELYHPDDANQSREAMQEFLTGKPVASMRGDEVPVFSKFSQLAEWVGQFFQQQHHGKAVSPILGEVLLNERSAKDSISHGLSRTKAQAFYLVPEVIANGRVIGQEPHGTEGRGYVVAAPVEIGGQPHIELAVIREDKTSRRFYVHEAILTEKVTAASSKTGLLAVSSQVHGADTAGTLRSLLRDIFTVKPGNYGTIQTRETDRGVELYQPEDANKGESEDSALPKDWIGKRLRDVSRELPRDIATPRLMDVARSNAEIVQDAAKEFQGWQPTMTAADGSEVLLHNTEGGSMAARVRHLIFDNEGSRLDASKAEWLPMVPDTLANAQLRLVDDETGNRLFVRQYSDGTKHMVVVAPNGVVEEQLPFQGGLITQFPDERRTRRGNMVVDWVRGGKEKTAIGQPPSVPAPTPTGSTVSGPVRQSEFRDKTTQKAGEVKPGELYQDDDATAGAYRIEERDGRLWIVNAATGAAYKPGVSIYSGENTPEERARLENNLRVLLTMPRVTDWLRASGLPMARTTWMWTRECQTQAVAVSTSSPGAHRTAGSGQGTR
jgi:hypothetical protein